MCADNGLAQIDEVNQRRKDPISQFFIQNSVQYFNEHRLRYSAHAYSEHQVF